MSDFPKSFVLPPELVNLPADSKPVQYMRADIAYEMLSILKTLVGGRIDDDDLPALEERITKVIEVAES